MGKFTFKPVVFEAERFEIPDGKILNTKEKPPGKNSKKAVRTDADFHVAGRTLPVMLDKDGPYVLVPGEHYEKARPGMWVMESGDDLFICEDATFRQMYQPASPAVVKPGSAADVFRGQLLGRNKHGSN